MNHDHDEEDKRVFDILNKPAKLLSLKELCDLPLVSSHIYMNKEDFDELMKFADAPTEKQGDGEHILQQPKA